MPLSDEWLTIDKVKIDFTTAELINKIIAHQYSSYNLQLTVSDVVNFAIREYARSHLNIWSTYVPETERKGEDHDQS